jgi:hypothetical protein
VGGERSAIAPLLKQFGYLRSRLSARELTDAVSWPVGLDPKFDQKDALLVADR